MSIPTTFSKMLKLPLMAAPMFLASNPALVLSCCRSGIIGSFPAKNQRSLEGLEKWLREITDSLNTDRENGHSPAPFAVNLIVHKSNAVLQQELDLCAQYKVPIIVTSLGAVTDLVTQVHDWGGIVFHDIISCRHAKKAANAGVDGLICVSAGAGGHTGQASPFALINEVRQFFSGTILLSGALSSGRDLAAAQMMGADLGYMGTRFIATQECASSAAYKQMIIDSACSDIVLTDRVTGVHANFMQSSLEQFSPEEDHAEIDINKELNDALDTTNNSKKPWRDVWSAGHGVGSIETVLSVHDLVQEIATDYHQAVLDFAKQAAPFGAAQTKTSSSNGNHADMPR